MKTYIYVGEDEGVYISSSLAVIHATNAAKTLFELLHNLPLHAHHVIKKGSPLFAIYTSQTMAIDQGGEGGRSIEGSS